jgi:hypothetical protein
MTLMMMMKAAMIAPDMSRDAEVMRGLRRSSEPLETKMKKMSRSHGTANIIARKTTFKQRSIEASDHEDSIRSFFFLAFHIRICIQMEFLLFLLLLHSYFRGQTHIAVKTGHSNSNISISIWQQVSKLISSSA